MQSGFDAGVRAQPLAARHLRDPGEVLVGVPRVVVDAEDGHLVGRHAGDAQVVDHHERADAAAHRHERDVDDRDPGPGDHLVGPHRGVDQLRGEVAHPGQLLALEDAGARRLDGVVRAGRLRERREPRPARRRDRPVPAAPGTTPPTTVSLLTALSTPICCGPERDGRALALPAVRLVLQRAVAELDRGAGSQHDPAVRRDGLPVGLLGMAM